MEHKIIVLSLIILALSVPALAEPLKVKPGLWETRTTTERRNARQPSNLDKLNQEQREKVEKKLAENVKKDFRTVQACLSESQIRNGEAFIGKTHQTSCVRTFGTRTSSDLIATVECNGANPMTGSISMHAADQENMNGTVDMTYGVSDKLQLQTHSEITGRWLKADCGDVTRKLSQHH